MDRLPRAFSSPFGCRSMNESRQQQAGAGGDERAPKLRSVSQCYISEAEQDKEEGDSEDEWSEWEESKPVKKRRVSTIRDEWVTPPEPSTMTTTTTTKTFKTLAQLLEPQRNVRIKSYPTKRRSCMAGSMASRRVRRFYTKSRLRSSSCTTGKNSRNLEGNIGLVVELVFERDVVDDGLSSSNSPLKTPLEMIRQDSMDELLLVNGENSPQVSTYTDDERSFEVFKDPFSLRVGSCFTKHVAESISIYSPFRSHLKWREIDVGNTEPAILVHRTCKVHCALENRWFPAFVAEYDQDTRRHLIKYDEKDERWHFLVKERVAFYVSLDEKISVFCGYREIPAVEDWRTKTEELLVFAVSVETSDRFFNHGDIVWAETPGYPMWPAFVMNEQHAVLCGGEMISSPNSTPVHFFGSHDFARVKNKRVFSFSKGLAEEFHLNCSRVAFVRGLEEVDRYFKEQKLPELMAYLRRDVSRVLSQDKGETEDDEDFVGDERKHKVRKSLESIFKCPIKLGSLRVLSLGKIVKDSEYFHDQHYIWTEGYTSVRKFFSMKDPSKMVNYKMEILRNPNARTMPLFRVAPEDWEQVEGPSAAACWKKIFDKLHKARNKLMMNLNGQADKRKQFYRSGAAMFGLTHPRVSRLIQALPYARVCSKFKVWADSTPSGDTDGLLPAGFKHVNSGWKHLDHCSVCDTNEEYDGNVLLQCDKCRMLVHRNCYGVVEAPGDSWLCNLCDVNAPKRSPPCCLCPIIGGAMKRTTDGRWVHLACALWIPETSCVDMERMEPIEGICSINKERWKLTCSICKVPYGACIQCADHHCRVSYHPLCARAEGFSTKVLEGLRRKRNKITGLLEEERSVQLLSYCKKHTNPGKNSNKVTMGSDVSPYDFHNPSGSARSEPYNFAARRGRREPEHYSSALAKRAFLQHRPYIVTGCLRSPYVSGAPSNSSKDVPLSTSQRFLQMRNSLHHRLTFGKSAIHGWGLFAKQAHEAGDMVIEYAGEIIRPVVADVRERSCYNSLVGAGTYMFCIDNERVIDATRSGSIAHLINHSCEPNCYSRVVPTGGRERIIIFAKQAIAGGEEVTYDYRFTSIGDQLACHCGSASCRGIVNMTEEEDDSGRILVRTSELTKWQQ